jgi:hypothetical protein
MRAVALMFGHVDEHGFELCEHVPTEPAGVSFLDSGRSGPPRASAGALGASDK